MTPKPGIYTSEFWLTAVANICGALLALLAGYRLITQEEGALWLALAQALAAAIVPLALAYTNGRYIDSRAQLKTAVERSRSANRERTLAEALWADDCGLALQE